MNICSVCHLNSSDKTCGYCSSAICKKCSHTCSLEMNEWYINKKEIHHLSCPDCYEQKFIPLEENFDEDMQTAKDSPVWPKTYRGKIPMLNRSQKQFSIQDCADKKLAVLKLAFQAIEGGFNALLEVDVKYTKVRDHGYQKMLYSGTALGAMVDHSKLRDEDYFEDL